MTAKRILIVEDDPDTAEFLNLHLMAKGYEVSGSATSGEYALISVSADPPDLVIMDIQLEGDMDGIETSQVIREEYGIPTLFLTGHSSDELFERAKISEPFAYLLKPFNERELELTIEISLYRHELEQQLQNNQLHLNAAQEIGNIGSWDWNIVSGALYWSDQIYRIFGLRPQEFGATYDAFVETIHPDDREAVQNAVNAALEGEKYDIQHRIVRKDGEERIVRERGDVTMDSGGTPVRMLGTVQDITAMHQAEAKIKHLAFYDSVTGLPNRNLFFDRLGQMLALTRRQDTGFALMVIDLDGFKAVNDSFGHQVGDELLKKVGERLQDGLRELDSVARTGGDEFAALLHGCGSEGAARAVGEKLITSCARTFRIGGNDISIGCSIGIAFCPRDGMEEDQLVKCADDAMYQAKRDGKNGYRFYCS